MSLVGLERVIKFARRNFINHAESAIRNALFMDVNVFRCQVKGIDG